MAGVSGTGTNMKKGNKSKMKSEKDFTDFLYLYNATKEKKN